MTTEHAGEAQPHSNGPSGVRTHLLVAVLLAMCTAIAFGAVGGGVLPTAVLLPLITVLAIAQITLQAAFYMHLRRDRRLFSLVFASAALLALFIGWTVWYLLQIHPGRT